MLEPLPSSQSFSPAVLPLPTNRLFTIVVDELENDVVKIAAPSVASFSRKSLRSTVNVAVPRFLL